ncbi:MAG TPA: ATP-binding protein [Herpetosiphonaceae bacterium]
MNNAAIVSIVQHQLAAGICPSANQTEALLAMIDTLQAELRAAGESKQSYRALHESEARYRTIVELMSDYAYVFQVAPDGHLSIEWMTKAFARVSGYTVAEIDALGWRSLIHPDDLPITQQSVETLIAGNKTETEFRIITKTGEERWLYNCARPEWDDQQGRVVRIIGAASDITERKRADDRLHFLARTSALLNASLNYNATLDQVAHFTVPFLADACFIDLLADEYAPRRLIIAHADPQKEQRLCDMYDQYPVDQQWPEPIKQVVQTRRSALLANISEALLESVSVDDSQLNVLKQLNFQSAMIVPVLVHERMFGTMIFVSERIHQRYTQNDLAFAEELAAMAAMALDNARLYSKAQAAVEARDEFLSIAAHELKTPTGALLAATQLICKWLPQEQEPSERMRRELDVISVASKRLNKLIDSLTEFAQLQTGRFTLEHQPVVLCTLARQVLSQIQPSSRHYVALFCADETLTIEGDPLRLERVLYNLTQNAIKYSPRGGPITVRIERQGDQAVIQVKDQGIGIPEAAQSHVFQRFYRAGNAIQQHIGGTGIGLYLVKEIVTRHGGTVAVSSMEGYGSTFTITLPLTQPQSQE